VVVWCSFEGGVIIWFMVSFVGSFTGALNGSFAKLLESGYVASFLSILKDRFVGSF
jgi:hypothetical protein